jgi:hypothetical protein
MVKPDLPGKKPANTQKSKKKTSTSWKPGQTGNPRGRPKEGTSLTSIWKELLEQTPEQLASYLDKSNPLGQSYSQMPKKLLMKYLLVLRYMSAMMFEPQAAMLNLVWERMDGKVPDQMLLENNLNIDGIEKALEKVYAKRNSGS